MSLENLIEQAFNYRGDVTIDLNEGPSITGYLYNRNRINKTIEVFVGNTAHPLTIPYNHIKNIRLTGVDTAAGKSWEAWLQKKSLKEKTP